MLCLGDDTMPGVRATHQCLPSSRFVMTPSLTTFPSALTGRPYNALPQLGQNPERLTGSSVITRIRCVGLEYGLAISEDKFNFIRHNHARPFLLRKGFVTLPSPLGEGQLIPQIIQVNKGEAHSGQYPLHPLFILHNHPSR